MSFETRSKIEFAIIVAATLMLFSMPILVMSTN